MTKRASAKHIDGVEFVIYWNGAASLQAIANHFKISNRAATHKALFYRRHGCELKKFLNSGPRYDWDKIRAAAKQSMPKQ